MEVSDFIEIAKRQIEEAERCISENKTSKAQVYLSVGGFLLEKAAEKIDP